MDLLKETMSVNNRLRIVEHKDKVSILSNKASTWISSKEAGPIKSRQQMVISPVMI